MNFVRQPVESPRLRQTIAQDANRRGLVVRSWASFDLFFGLAPLEAQRASAIARSRPLVACIDQSGLGTSMPHPGHRLSYAGRPRGGKGGSRVAQIADLKLSGTCSQVVGKRCWRVRKHRDHLHPRTPCRAVLDLCVH
jgi:hypothetical protein